MQKHIKERAVKEKVVPKQTAKTYSMVVVTLGKD
jgi:hypothetical protein